MQVDIDGRYYSFIPDFDPVDIQKNVTRNWRVSAGDYFKYPVRIGPVDCFIKRFDKKASEISGYAFLTKIKGILKPGLPFVYDMARVSEGNREVFYLIMEYIPGDTLEGLQRNGFEFVPSKLAGDLFTAFQSVHESGYWFPDFDPKNLYRGENGHFYVIDLDSSYPLKTLPQNKMFGSKDYWSPVYSYYRDYEKFTPDLLKEIRGDVMNMLQLLFFLSLYAYYLHGEGEDLTPVSIEKLNGYLSERYKLFASTMRYCCRKDPETAALRQRPLTREVFDSFVQSCLFKGDQRVSLSTKTKAGKRKEKPNIYFVIKPNKAVFEPGERYQLIWQADHTQSVSLDGRQQALAGSVDLTASASLVHILECKGPENGAARATIAVTVEVKPVVTCRTNVQRTRVGKMVAVSWEVKNGRNASLRANGTVILNNLPSTGTRYVVAVMPKMTFSLSAQSMSGPTEYQSPPVQVEVLKKRNPLLWWWLVPVIALVFVIVGVNNCSTSRNRYSGDEARLTDTTAAVPAAAAMDTTKAVMDTVARPAVTMDTAKMSADTTKLVQDTAAVAQAPVKQDFYFSDAFSGNMNDWPLPNTSDVQTFIDGARLHMEITGTGMDMVKKRFDIDAGEDFTLYTSTGWVDGDVTGGDFGLICCDNDGRILCYFYIVPDGHFGVCEFLSGKWNCFTKEYSSFIITGKYFNDLKLQKTGGLVYFYINGHFVHSEGMDLSSARFFGFLAGNQGTKIVSNFFSLSGKRSD